MSSSTVSLGKTRDRDDEPLTGGEDGDFKMVGNVL